PGTPRRRGAGNPATPSSSGAAPVASPPRPAAFGAMPSTRCRPVPLASRWLPRCCWRERRNGQRPAAVILARCPQRAPAVPVSARDLRGSIVMRDPVLVPRLRPFASTVFAEMTALATRTGSVNLGQGCRDTDGPAGVRAAAQRAIADGVNQYPPGRGRPELREAIAEHRTRYGTEFDPESEVLVTAGATEAITAALLGLTDAEDEVIVLAPYYDSYAAAVAMAGARRLVVPPARTTGTFRPDLDAIRAASGPRPRATVVNPPHSPTGTVLGRDELARLAALCVEHDLIAITDEVYEHLVFSEPAGREHIPLGTFPG